MKFYKGQESPQRISENPQYPQQLNTGFKHTEHSSNKPLYSSVTMKFTATLATALMGLSVTALPLEVSTMPEPPRMPPSHSFLTHPAGREA